METTKKKVRPNPLATFEEKKDPSYGLQIAEYISREWFNGTFIGSGCQFMGRRNWVENKRLYARGEQDTKQYKNVVARQQSDLSYLNLDWRPINVCEKFCNIVSNGISEENYRLDIRATDRFSLLERKKKVDEHIKNMISRNIVEKAKKELNLDIAPKGFVPEDEEELKFVTEIKDRPKAEIAEEITIDYVKKINDWKNIKDQCDKDIVEVGLMCAQVYTDPLNGISLRYVDPEEAIHSYVKKNDFSDCFYYGYVDSITLSDIRREGNYDDVKLREIAKAYGPSNNMNDIDFERCVMDDIIDIKLNVLRFAWKTTKTLSYKKYMPKGNPDGKPIKVARRSDNWEVPEEGAKSKLSKTYDTWLEGVHIIGTQEIYGYKECENIVKDEMNKVKPPFVFRASAIYKNRLHSFLSNIEALCDQMQYAHLKIQHLMAELTPDMKTVDLDQLADLSSDTKGEAKQETWKTALTIMAVKGVIFTKRVDMGEMGIKDGTAARPMPMAQGSSLGALLNVWAHYYNLLRETTGINPARDGSLPADALLGVNQMAQLASNTVTKHIVDAAKDFDKTICEIISIRLKSIFTYKGGENIVEMYKRSVGKHNIEAMETMKNRHLYDFGFTIEMVPTKEEMAEFKEDLALAMKEGTIDVEDKIEAQSLAKVNVKLATEYLKFIRKIRIKRQMKEKQDLIAAQTQANIQSSEANSVGKVKAYGLQKQIDMDVESRMSQIRVAEKAAMQQIEAPVKDKEFQQDVYIKQLETATAFNLKKYTEDAKDLRIDQQSTNQSKILDQRTKDTGPIDFKNQFEFDDINV